MIMIEHKVMKDLAIIILNYNSSDKIVNQVTKLMDEGISSSNFYIVDNNSEKKDKYNLFDFTKSNNLNFIQSIENGGYAEGNRLAIEKSVEDKKNYFLILNPDIEIAGSIVQNLYNAMIEDEELYILGPRICEKENREIIFSDGGKLNTSNFFEANHINIGKNIKDIEMPTFNYDIDYINGSAMMFKKELLNLIGRMREDFFMYYEETEWCYRLDKVPNAKQAIMTSMVVYHELSKDDPFKKFYLTRNRIFMCRLHNLPHQKLVMHLLYESQKSLFNKKSHFTYNIQLFFSQLRAILQGEFRKLD